MKKEKEYDTFYDVKKDDVIVIKKEKVYRYVYILFKNNNAIYVGGSKKIEVRISQHKMTKDFDSYILIGPHYNDLHLTICEKSTIALFKKLYPKTMLNKISVSGCSDLFLNKKCKNKNQKPLKPHETLLF